MAAPASKITLETTETPLKGGVLRIPDVVFTSVAAQAPGGAVALNFFFAILFAGAAFPLAMLVSLVATLFLANTLTQFSKHLSSSSGFGVFVARGLGPRAGVFTMWCALFYGILFPAEVVVLISQVITNLVNPALGINIPWQVLDIAFIAIIGFFAYTGVKRSARVTIITGLIEISIFLTLGIFLVARAGHANTFSVFTPTTGVFGLTWGLIYGFLSFTGFESVASLAEETRNPKKNIGRCAISALIAIGVFYVFLAYAGVVAWPHGKLNGGSTPAFFSANSAAYEVLAKHIWGPFQWIILVAIVNSVVACSLAALNFAARYFYSFGRLELLPRQLGNVHPKYRTPSVAVGVMIAFTLVLSLGLGSWWGPTLAFGFLATAFTYGWILMFIMANVALPFFYRKEHPADFSVLKHIVLPIIGTLALVPAIVAPLLPYLPRFAAAGPVSSQIVSTVPLTVFWALIGVAAVVIMARRSPEKVALAATDFIANTPSTETASSASST